MQQKFYLQLCINRFIYDHILPDRTTRVCQRLGTFQADLTQCKHCVVDLVSFGQLRAEYFNYSRSRNRVSGKCCDVMLVKIFTCQQ